MFGAITRGAGASTQQRVAFQQKEEQEPTKTDTEALNWITNSTLHYMWFKSESHSSLWFHGGGCDPTCYRN